MDLFGGIRLSSNPFDPRRISGLTHWFRGDRVGLSGGKVASWIDLSGSGNTATQGSGTAQPTWVDAALNGRPVVRFDGSTSFINIPIGSAAAPRTYVFAFSSSRSTSNRVFDHATTTYPMFGFYFDGSRQLYLGGATNYRYFATSPKPGDGSPHVCVLTITGTAQSDIANATLHIDGSALAGSAPVTTSSPVATVSTMQLGGSTNRFLGDIAELVMYGRALSSDERAQVEAYIKTRYGIT
ncbi:LamG-like jellyroll fold domain-containing protein [Sorangium sp. So ce1389]|uniref:LamG-like jellyroll fold domain-containing protein n=1 Tax=Sorangium sp. So ce1389 TaxID=3133336 RepID=UPI003F613E7F